MREAVGFLHNVAFRIDNQALALGVFTRSVNADRITLVIYGSGPAQDDFLAAILCAGKSGHHDDLRPFTNQVADDFRKPEIIADSDIRSAFDLFSQILLNFSDDTPTENPVSRRMISRIKSDQSRKHCAHFSKNSQRVVSS